MNPPYKVLLNRALLTGIKVHDTRELIAEQVILDYWEDLPSRPNFNRKLAEVLSSQTLNGIFDLNEITSAAPNAKLDRFEGALSESISIGHGIPLIYEMLSHNSNTRRAVIHVANIATPNPCLSTAPFMIRRNKLVSIYTMRSWDLWLGLPYDMYVFRDLSTHIANHMSIETSQVIVNAASAHIYEDDVAKVERFILNRY